MSAIGQAKDEIGAASPADTDQGELLTTEGVVGVDDGDESQGRLG